MPVPPLVSVLMTVYNREKYIAEAIESVLQSTYSDFELIIVDDHSTDNSVEIARGYERTDFRIKVYQNEKNIGQFQNRNRAAQHANGKYLKFLDSDDIIYSHGLEVMVASLDQFPTAGFAIQNIIPEDDLPYPYLLKAGKSVEQHFLKRPFLTSGPSGVIFKKKAFWSVNGFAQPVYTGSDTEILLKLSCKYDLVLFPPGLIWWRRHEQQEFILGVRRFDYYLNDYCRMISIINTDFSPENHVVKKLILKKLRNLQIGRILKLFRMRKLMHAYQLLKALV